MPSGCPCSANINFEQELFSYVSEEEIEQHPLITLLDEMEAGRAPDTGDLCVHLNSMNNNAKPRLDKVLELELELMSAQQMVALQSLSCRCQPIRASADSVDYEYF